MAVTDTGMMGRGLAHRDVAFAIGVTLVLAMLFIPLPAVVQSGAGPGPARQYTRRTSQRRPAGR